MRTFSFKDVTCGYFSNLPLAYADISIRLNRILEGNVLLSLSRFLIRVVSLDFVRVLVSVYVLKRIFLNLIRVATREH